MKIAMVVSTFPPDIGGMGTVVYEEAVRLASFGHAVTVYTLRYNHEYPKDTFPFQVVRLLAWPRLGDAGIVLSLIRHLHDASLVHFHFPFYGAGLFTLLAVWRYKLPLVITYHMDARPTHAFKRFIQRFSDRLVARALFKHAAKVLVPDIDHFGTTKLNTGIRREQTSMLANGVDEQVFKPGKTELPQNLEMLAGKNILLFVGNLLPVKRLDVVVRALARLPEDYVLLVVGGGYAEAAYRQLVGDLKLQHRVFFTGVCLDRKNLARYYRLADAVVIPSDYESFSLVALEAMASGTPVIASDVPGLRQRVVDGMTGFLFTPGSVDDLTTTLVRFFDFPEAERAKFGESGREKALAFTWEQHVNALVKQYESLV